MTAIVVHPPPRRATAPLSWTIVVLAVASVALSMVLSWPSFASEGADLWVNVGLAIGFPTAGALIVGRVRNLVGWLLLEIGAAAAATLLTVAYSERALVDHAGSLPAGPFVVWVSDWTWVFGALPAITLLPMVFPNGRLVSRRWAGFAAASIAAMGAAALNSAFAPTLGLRGHAPILNPVLALDVGLAGALVGPLVLVGVGGGIASVIVRWRRSTGAVREQMKWFVFAVVVVAAMVAAQNTVIGGTLGAAVAAPAILLLPAAVVVAVLRYRLYDIDVLVNRTIVYVLATGLLLAVYLGVVTTIERFVGQPTPADGGLARPALGAGVVAIAFSPFRAWVQRRVNRLLYGDRGDPAAVLDRFGSLASEAESSDELLASLATAVAQALQVPYVEVTTVVAGGGSPGSAVVGRRSGPCRRIDLEDNGAAIGALEVGHRSRRARFSTEDERVLTVLGASRGAR